MADDKTISDLTAAAAFDGSELLHVVQGGNSRKGMFSAILDYVFSDRTALSVLGRSADSSGAADDIVAGSDHQVLRRSGTGIGFGSVALDQSAAVTGALGADNGGTGVANNPAATLTRSGNHALTLTTSGTTDVTLPTTGTLATRGGSETLTNKTLTSPVIDTSVSGSAVQSSATDATQGRLTKVGAFGIGITGTGHTIVNLDDPATPSGLYRFVTSTSSGTPPAAVSGYALLQRYAGDFLHQTFIREEGSSRGVWTREYRTSAWTAWERVLRNHNILGTVGQSSGVPTGALIERGSNANGEYVRFADGTQICTWSSGSVGPIDTASGNVFRSGAITWSAYPAAFTAVTPKVIWTVDHPAGTGGIWLARETTQATTSVPGGVYMMRSVTSPVTTAVVGATAIGRWF